MLVLSRKLLETIVITHPALDQPIRITVTDIDRGKIRLGVTAETAARIMREELLNGAGEASKAVRMLAHRHSRNHHKFECECNDCVCPPGCTLCPAPELVPIEEAANEDRR